MTTDDNEEDDHLVLLLLEGGLGLLQGALQLLFLNLKASPLIMMIMIHMCAH